MCEDFMKPKYSEWIDVYLLINDPRGHCAEATEMMKKSFPELLRVRGHVVTAFSPQPRPHWWLIDPTTHEIVDPTESQFLCILQYLPHDESQPEPTGKCPNCGSYCYNHSSVCSDKCGEEYKAYIESSCLGL